MLQSGTYGDIYNFPQKQYESALAQEEVEDAEAAAAAEREEEEAEMEEYVEGDEEEEDEEESEEVSGRRGCCRGLGWAGRADWG
jgi:protein MAK16